jgi:TnpA family transposase
LLKERVSTRLIVEHWEELKRLAGSIRHGVTPSSVLMRKLASYPRQNHLAQALAEVGKVEQTLHLLDCYRDEVVRRQRKKQGRLEAMTPALNSVPPSVRLIAVTAVALAVVVSAEAAVSAVAK